MFEVQKRYGDNELGQAQKQYWGKNPGEIRHRDLTANGPLIRIVSIVIDGREITLGRPLTVASRNGMTLTEVIASTHEAVETYISSDLMYEGLMSEEMKIYVVDATCHSSDTTPNIGVGKNESKLSKNR
jgi:hypothetical protein